MDPPYRGNIVDELNKKIDSSETPDLDSFFSLDLLPQVENIRQENEVHGALELQGMWSKTPELDSSLYLEPFSSGLNVLPGQEVYDRQEPHTQFPETPGFNISYSLDVLPAGTNIVQEQGIQSVPESQRIHEEEIRAETQDRIELEEQAAKQTTLNSLDSTKNVPGPSALHAVIQTGYVLDNVQEEQINMETVGIRELDDGTVTQTPLITVDNLKPVEDSSAANVETQTACISDSIQEEQIATAEIDQREASEEITCQPALFTATNLETAVGTSATHVAIQTSISEEERKNLSAPNDVNHIGNFEEDTIKLTEEPAIIETVSSKDGKIRFKCDFCEATFTLKRVLAQHRKISHKVGTCLYTCAECEKRFRNQQQLDNHVQRFHRVDPDEKKKKCTKCPLSFLDKTTLKNHMRVVHGEQSGKFRCEECHVECYNASYLHEHIQAVHRNVVNTCSVCGKSYKYRRDLTRHKKTKNH